MTPPFHNNDPVILRGHSSYVNFVAFSPSDQLLASASSDKTIRLWNTESWTVISTLYGHSRDVCALAFSPDGNTLASGALDHTVKLWDVGSKAETGSLKGHSSTIWSVSFSHDGVQLVSCSADRTIRMWDVKSRTHIIAFHGHSGWVNSVAFSPDGKTIASGSDDKTIRLWNVTSGSATVLEGHVSSVKSIAFSPNGEQIVSGCRDNTIGWWNIATGTCTTTTGHSGAVDCVTLSPNGKFLASGSFDNTVRLWDVASRSHIYTLEGHSGRISSVAFSSDSNRLASGSHDRTIRIWNVPPAEKWASQYPTSAYNLAEVTQNTTYSQQDTLTPLPPPVPLNNDITGSVSLRDDTPIGSGGFGELFLGVHADRGKVALKRPRRLLDEALIRRFLREVDLWCSVSHPHILPCLGMCQIGPYTYVVSPFIENGDLLSCMIRGMDLNRSKLLFEVATALTHLHHNGIVHGDVKAQNILLADNGSALLCDFGLAKAFDTMATSTEAKGAGSVRWMAPELFLGESRSMATDVFSLGITIAEVLSGHAPYQAMSENLAVMLHVAYHDGRPAKEPLSSPEGKSYATLWETAEKCWVKDAKARPYMAQVLGMLFPLTRGGQ